MEAAALKLRIEVINATSLRGCPVEDSHRSGNETSEMLMKSAELANHDAADRQTADTCPGGRSWPADIARGK